MLFNAPHSMSPKIKYIRSNRRYCAGMADECAHSGALTVVLYCQNNVFGC